MKNISALCAIVLLVFTLASCGSGDKPGTDTQVAEQQAGHVPTVPSIDCEVTSGPNKGKKGKRSGDGWCEGDWGGTECKPASKCKAVTSSGPEDAGITQPVGDTGTVDGGFGNGNPIIGIVPSHGSPAHEYCRRDESILSVVFANTGSMGSSGGIDVIVTFDADPEIEETQPMPGIPAGGTVDMSFEIPPGCFNADCEFTVQWSNQPATFGRCIG